MKVGDESLSGCLNHNSFKLMRPHPDRMSSLNFRLCEELQHCSGEFYPTKCPSFGAQLSPMACRRKIAFAGSIAETFAVAVPSQQICGHEFMICGEEERSACSDNFRNGDGVDGANTQCMKACWATTEQCEDQRRDARLEASRR